MARTEIKYGEETLTFAGEEFYTSPKGAKAMLEKYGLAIIPDRLTPEECQQMNEGMWNTAEYLTSKLSKPLKRSDPSTYYSVINLLPKDGGLFQKYGWGHAQYVWDVRSHPKVAEVFEEVYGTKELLVSFDGINCGLGPVINDPKILPEQKGMYQGKHNLHCEQRFIMNDFEQLQTWVTANPIGKYMINFSTLQTGKG